MSTHDFGDEGKQSSVCHGVQPEVLPAAGGDGGEAGQGAHGRALPVVLVEHPDVVEVVADRLLVEHCPGVRGAFSLVGRGPGVRDRRLLGDLCDLGGDQLGTSRPEDPVADGSLIVLLIGGPAGCGGCSRR